MHHNHPQTDRIPTLIDIGVNLEHRSFERDRDAVVARALAAGVKAMVLTGTTLRSSQAVQGLAQQRPGVLYATAGIHPHNARDWNPETLQALQKLAEHPSVVAIGECGLDFNRDFSPRPQQEAAFVDQLELACQRQMPVFMHERDAHDRFVAILRAYRPRLKAGVVHCFTGDFQALKAYLELDLHIGITGWICDERRGQDLRKLVHLIPADRLMLETDAPFLTPRDLKPAPHQGRNEPAFLPHILQTVAECQRRSAADVARTTTATACRFFGIECVQTSA